MARVRIFGASICLVYAGAGLYLLASTTLRAAPQAVLNPPPSGHSRSSPPTKPTWHSGPASSPPETEVIPPTPPPAPPAVRPILDSSRTQKRVVARNPRTAPHVHSVAATKSLPPAAAGPAPTANVGQPNDANSPDPEAQRIHEEFTRLREDAGARAAFYDDLRHTVEQVRAGTPDEGLPQKKATGFVPFSRFSQTPAGPVHFQPPASGFSHIPAAPVRAPYSPDLHEPDQPPPPEPPAPHSSVSNYGGRIDSVPYQRVVRWAKANGAPVPLALGVAWMESHLHTDAPLGAAGEVGMFQIMPERCRLEGYSPKRLEEPEFNAWLGTRLLARYFKEEGSWERAAAKYVAGPRVFEKDYSQDMWTYINSYASSVDNYAGYFSRYLG